MTMAGQTINDRLLAARHSLAGQGLAKSVCKATTEELIAPKKKHLDYLVHCTNEPNVSIPQLATLLIERSQNTNWVVVYKALITTHHLMAYGNERFMQYLASSNSSFNLSSFLDKGTNDGGVGMPGGRLGYDMSPFIRRYANYLNEKSLSYRSMAFDFCKVKRNKEDNSLRGMNVDKLLKALPILQGQLDALLEFDCRASDLSNSVINVSFMLLFRDLIRLFACYNEGTINLLEKYFDMNKKNAREALDLYKKFLVRMDRVGEFLKVAENVGINKGDIPDLTKAPSSLMDALEVHLAALEGRKMSATNTPTQASSNQMSIQFGVSALSFTSSSFGTAVASGKFDNNNGFDEQLKAQALAEEEAAMNKYKSKVSSPTGSAAGASAALTNPFLSSPPATKAGAPMVDLFGAAQVSADAADSAAKSTSAKASDDLLQLGNPFADVFDAPITGSSGSNGAPCVAPNAFVSDSNFTSVFGDSNPEVSYYEQNPFFNSTDDQMGFNNKLESNSLDDFGRSSQPVPISSTPMSARLADQRNTAASVDPLGVATQQISGSLTFGGAVSQQPAHSMHQLRPQQQQQQQQQQQHLFQQKPTQQTDQTLPSTGRIITGDLDSSLMFLVENLNISKSSSAKPVQWNSPKNTAKSGGASNWTPQPMQATTGAGYRPMGMQSNPQTTMLCQAAPLTGMQPTMMQRQSNQMMATPQALQPLWSVQVHNGASNNNTSMQLDPFGAL